MSGGEFREKAVEEKGLFVLRERGVDEDGEQRESVRYKRDSNVRLPLNRVDTDARLRTIWRRDTRARLPYQENMINEHGGITTARTSTCSRSPGPSRNTQTG